MGILAAARAFGLDFIPVAREPYDLVLRASTVDDDLLAPLWALLQQIDFRTQVESLGGYSCAETGQRIR
jgi:putative molybdopterin biosynthesis protein